jgi:septal ring factor EnvC (AmiA/AmiB activator)
MRLRSFAAGVALPLAAWGISPLVADAGGPGASAASLNNKIQQVQGKIGRKKGTERVLSTQIAAYSARIDRLQAKITRLRTTESQVQTALDRNRAELRQIQADLRA